MYRTYVDVEGTFKVYSDYAAIYRNLDLKKVLFSRVLLFLGPCILSVAMVSIACGGRSTEAANNDSYISHKFFTGQIFETGFIGDFFLF